MEPIVYIDRSEIRPGARAQLRDAVARLVAFVEEHEPQLAVYSIHLDENASAMTVLAVHPDSASLELHLRVGGPEFRRVGEFILLRSIDVYGEPSPIALELLEEKAKMLGDATVAVHPRTAGFSRFYRGG